MIDWLRRSHAEPQVEVDGRVLPIAIRRHPRATRLTMRLAPDGSELRLTMPAWGRTGDALDFAQAKRDWIAAQLARLPQALAIHPGALVPYRGRQIMLDWQEKALRRPRLVDDETCLLLGGPQNGMAARLRRWLEAEALAHAADDLAFYCQRAGQPVPQLRLSRAQRRWGSCTSEKTTGQGVGRCIRINWRLVMAPDTVRRSVVAHEVAHLAHFDHSPAFHAMLGELFEHDLAAADLWLKREGRGLYAAFG